MSNITIRDIKAICTAPVGINLIVVKIETSEPGLYGLGCATFAYRHLAVACLVEQYFKPLLVGRDVANIEDLWHLMNVNSYWRNGPVTNNAISGIDMALWDIKGKVAKMPVYDLLGGKVRQAAALYTHASGKTLEGVGDKVQQFMDMGYRHIRVDYNGYGGTQADEKSFDTPAGSPQGIYYDPDLYYRNTLELFEYVRNKFGFGIEFCHDTHEKISPANAVRLAKDLEKYRLFFLEDLLPPEQIGWFKNIRNQCSTPLAIGELFNNPLEWETLVSQRLIDFIRVHISQIGGITPARKLAILCEQFGVKTAWHGPGDVSPVGHAANIHLDLAAKNFGIQEWTILTEDERSLEVFPGTPERKGGYAYLNGKPGLGIELDEKAAAKYPASDKITVWSQTRLPDGTISYP